MGLSSNKGGAALWSLWEGDVVSVREKFDTHSFSLF